MATSPFLLNMVSKGLTRPLRQEKETDIQVGKEKLKPPLSVDSICKVQESKKMKLNQCVNSDTWQVHNPHTGLSWGGGGDALYSEHSKGHCKCNSTHTEVKRKIFRDGSPRK